MQQPILFQDLFTTNLDIACRSYRYSMSEQTKQYIINIFANDLSVACSNKPDDLLDTFIICNEVPNTAEALDYLKHNGDYYLTIAGFMPEALCNRYTELDYYLYIGKYSYYRLSQRLPKELLYRNLSFDYMKLIYILNETFDLIRTKQNSAEVMKTLEAYNKTRHSIFRKRLTRMGISLAEITC